MRTKSWRQVHGWPSAHQACVMTLQGSRGPRREPGTSWGPSLCSPDPRALCELLEKLKFILLCFTSTRGPGHRVHGTDLRTDLRISCLHTSIYLGADALGLPHRWCGRGGRGAERGRAPGSAWPWADAHPHPLLSAPLARLPNAVRQDHLGTQ